MSHKMFNAGDRIQAIEGVCPGHFGTVTRVKSRATNIKDTTYYVLYDSGRTDSIFGYMLRLIEKADTYDID